MNLAFSSYSNEAMSTKKNQLARTTLATPALAPLQPPPADLTPEAVCEMVAKTDMTMVELVSPEIISLKCPRGHIHDQYVSTVVGCVGNGMAQQVTCPTCKCKSQFPNAVMAAAFKLTEKPFQLDHDIGISGESPRETRITGVFNSIDHGKKIVIVICRKGVGPTSVVCQDPLTIVLHPMSSSKIPSILRAYLVEYGILESSPPKMIKKSNSRHRITRKLTNSGELIEDMQLKKSSDEFIACINKNPSLWGEA